MVISTAVLVIAEWWVGFCVSMSRCGHLYILKNQKLQGGFLFEYSVGKFSPNKSFLGFDLVVGEKEKTGGTVNIRTRDNKVHGERTISETIARLQQLQRSRSKQAEEEF